MLTALWPDPTNMWYVIFKLPLMLHEMWLFGLMPHIFDSTVKLDIIINSMFCLNSKLTFYLFHNKVYLNQEIFSSSNAKLLLKNVQWKPDRVFSRVVWVSMEQKCFNNFIWINDNSWSLLDSQCYLVWALWFRW